VVGSHESESINIIIDRQSMPTYFSIDSFWSDGTFRELQKVSHFRFGPAFLLFFDNGE
jgi:hypothetical protein